MEEEYRIKKLSKEQKKKKNKKKTNSTQITQMQRIFTDFFKCETRGLNPLLKCKKIILQH